MSLTGRIERAEAGLLDALLLRAALQMAPEMGRPWQQLLRELEDENRRLLPYVLHLSSGASEDEAAVRAAAAREGVDYDQLKYDVMQQERSRRAKGRSG